MNPNDLPEFSFQMTTKVRFGSGVLTHLPTLITEIMHSNGSVFLITGRESLRRNGTLDQVLSSLVNFPTVHFDKSLPFPSPDLIEETLSACQKANPDVIVAIGGGSVLDLGKLVAALMTNTGSVLDYATGKRQIANQGIPFIAVPTTSGSSSEVTMSSAIWEMDKKLSYRVRHPLMYPTVALIDPELAMSMPQQLAAATGVDAFASAFESYWSTESQPITDDLALRTVRLFSEHLELSCTTGDSVARANCALASTISGIGYTNSRPNICHAFSQPLTLFWGTAHGQAVGLTLPIFLAWNAPAIQHKLPRLWDALGVNNLEEAQSRLTTIMRNCGLNTRFDQMGVSKNDLDLILDNVPWERLNTIPRPMTRTEAKATIKSLL